MKTQITLVQHNEEELESRRQHCKACITSISEVKTNAVQMSKSLTHLRVRSNFSPAIELTVGNTSYSSRSNA